MLKKIKSLYFVQNLFVYIDEKIKLKLIKYNKRFQKKLNISIINYMHFKGKYIIYESDRKGKEYNSYDDELKYEGECLNGERNGKGKEYYYGFLIFDVEYLKWKRNGKGEKYHINGELKFEGEYLNGKELIGTRYDDN